MTERVSDNEGIAQRAPWEPLRIAYVGRLDEVLQVGGGKLTAPGGDPGEPRKETPAG